ncbi:MAG: ion transporter [Steroidobacteraceae bacterium]
MTRSGHRDRLAGFIQSSAFQNTILALILVNAIVLGMETSPALMAALGPLLLGLDTVILGVFVVEILLRIYTYRGAFFRDPWGIFDLTVVLIALYPASGQLAVLRALRVLRVLRILTIVPSMRRVVGGLLAAIPGIGSIAMLLSVVFYVFAVIATKLFGATHPQWFGTIGESLYSLFQIMTLESWSMGIVRPVMEEHPYAWAFFVPFILIATFTMLNLFIGVIVSSIQDLAANEKADAMVAVDAARTHIEEDLHREIAGVRAEMAEIKTLLRNAQRSGAEQ